MPPKKNPLDFSFKDAINGLKKELKIEELLNSIKDIEYHLKIIDSKCYSFEKVARHFDKKILALEKKTKK